MLLYCILYINKHSDLLMNMQIMSGQNNKQHKILTKTALMSLLYILN